MKIKIPKDLTTLSKEQLIELVKELIAKEDNLISEVARERESKPKCGKSPCAKSPCSKSKCCK